MRKQSSIEWWIQVSAHNNILDHKALSSDKRLYDLYLRLKTEAKQMHKKEIIKILNKREDYLGTQPSVFDYLTNEEWFEQYYQETYGGNNE